MLDSELMPPPPRPFLNLKVTDGTTGLSFFVRRTRQSNKLISPEQVKTIIGGDRLQFSTSTDVGSISILKLARLSTC